MENIITRTILKDVEASLFRQRVVIIYGARQVGKTTLVQQILEKYPEKSSYYNCDEPDIRFALSGKTSTELKSFIGDKRLIVIDEAQRVENIGLTLKLLVDTFPEMQVIATGSSSFELANKINEPLTGRKYEFSLHPFSIEELTQVYDTLEIRRLLSDRLIFGSYPAIVFAGRDEKIHDLKLLSESYLFKDIFSFSSIKKPDLLIKLLKALALQIGSQVSYNELAQLIGIDRATVESYISLLEQAFILFRLPSFARNLRNELKYSKKIYFYDTGIRNALIQNFNDVDLRQDAGALWENFLIAERQKYISAHRLYGNTYFWRTQAQSEIDYIEEYDDTIHAFEFKWGERKKASLPKSFAESYSQASFEVIHRENFLDFVL